MLELYMYNAGKGDCIRIRYGDGHNINNIIIDSGVVRFGSRFQSICDGIRESGENIDLFILTHVDDDHIGGILSSLRCNWRCPVAEVRMNHTGMGLLGNAQLSTRHNDEVYARLQTQGIRISSMMAGDAIVVAGATLNTLLPNKLIVDDNRSNTPLAYLRDYGKSLKDLTKAPITRADTSINNRNSIVFIFEYSGKRILFTGDAWAKDIVDVLDHGIQHFDIIKLPHHGAVGNVSEELLNRIESDCFLICTDGVMHPDKQTIAKIHARYPYARIYSPANWWQKGFFTADDDQASVNLIQKELVIVQ